MELLILLAYMALGGGVWMVVALVLAGRERAKLERRILLDACAGCFGAVLVYLFATSVWAYAAVAERVPAQHSNYSLDELFYVLWDHTMLCAFVSSLLASVGAWLILRLLRFA